MTEYENKIELINYLNVLWKRKWFIVVSAFLFTIATAVIIYLLPKKWEVDAIFEPSKILIQTEGGIFREKFFYTPKEIANWTNLVGYNNLIATNLSLNINNIPKLKAENPTDTNLVRFSIEEKDVEKAKLILNLLLNHIKGDYDRMADFEREEIDTQIKSKETEKSLLEEEIQGLKKRFNYIKQRKKEIEKEMIDVRKRIEELEKERHLILNKKNRSEADNLSIFLYSNEIHQALINQSIQRGLLDNNKMEEEKTNLEIRNKEIKIDRIENEINDLNERKKNIYYVQITKEPTPSASPVSPKKLFNILIAVPLGFLIFTMLAFFFEYLEKQNLKAKESKA